MLSNEVSAAVAATARCSYWRAADARVVLAAWMDSDLSLSAFARHFGISVQRLRRWRDALAVEQPAEFHAVRVVERGMPVVRVAPSGPEGAALELILVGGRRVAVGPGFDEQTLVRLVRVAESLAC